MENNERRTKIKNNDNDSKPSQVVARVLAKRALKAPNALYAYGPTNLQRVFSGHRTISLRCPHAHRRAPKAEKVAFR